MTKAGDTPAPRPVPIRRAGPVSSRTDDVAGYDAGAVTDPPLGSDRGAKPSARQPKRVAAEDRPPAGVRRPSAIVRPASAGPCEPADIGILFRSRESHREFEAALERRGVSTYVYKGLGFFEADEIQDVVALLRFLADPTSDLRAAAFLRSRIVRLSDDGVRRLSGVLATAIVAADVPAAFERLSSEDRAVLAEPSRGRGALAGQRSTA